MIYAAGMPGGMLSLSIDPTQVIAGLEGFVRAAAIGARETYANSEHLLEDEKEAEMKPRERPPASPPNDGRVL